MDAKLLFLAAQISKLTMPSDYSGSRERCVVLTPESSILDIVQCLESNPACKTEKRFNRLKFLMKFFGRTLTTETIDRIANVVMLLESVSDDEEAGVLTLDQLKADIQKSKSLVFNKLSPTEKFVPSLVQHFHNECKSAVNHDGYVYDVFTAVATISLQELLSGHSRKSALRQMLLSKAKLIFKGGASIGKFLFESNKDLWESMTSEDQAFVKSNFINGGDNDTGLSFDIGEDSGYSAAELNDEIGSILYDLQFITMENVKRYHVEEIISQYLDSVVDRTFQFDDQKFSFDNRKACSFAVVEKNELQNEIIPVSNESERVFGSVSYLEFMDANGSMIKFFLGRIKAAFTAFSADASVVLNCYAECLDISATCVGSAVRFNAQYQSVDMTFMTKKVL